MEWRDSIMRGRVCSMFWPGTVGGRGVCELGWICASTLLAQYVPRLDKSRHKIYYLL